MKRSLLALALCLLGIDPVSARPHLLPRFVYVAPCRPCPCYVVPVPSVIVASPSCPSCEPTPKPQTKCCGCTDCGCCGGCPHCGVKAELLPMPKAK